MISLIKQITCNYETVPYLGKDYFKTSAQHDTASYELKKMLETKN
jgi:hypothetical protein